MPTPAPDIPPRRSRLRGALTSAETGTAAGLAGATLANNAIQLVFVVVFTRLLGASGYGALAALVSAFLILFVTGQSVQVAAARETTLGVLGDHAQLRATLARWTWLVLGGMVALGALCAVARAPIATALGVEEHAWAAAAVLPTGGLWLLLSLQRGVLQGLHAFKPVGVSIVGEALGRIVGGLALVGAGLDVTGAFLGTPVAFALTALFLGRELARRLGPPGTEGATHPLRDLVGDNWIPIVGLMLLAVLQNVDVIVARHVFDGDRAGSYAAAAVAAKAVVWVAVGVGLQLLPDATRRAATGRDPRPAVLRSLAVLTALAVPALLIFAAAGELLLRLAFGDELTQAADALPLLGLAMTLLAIAYLTVQYMVALGELRFVWVLAVLAIVEPFLLTAGDFGLVSFAAIVLGMQLVAASAMLVLGLRAWPAAALR